MKRSGFTPKSTWKWLQRGGKLRPLGKKGKTWKAKRDELKMLHETIGITTCELRYEGCAVDNYLGFAHAAKRRKLSADDLGHVILCCNFCHQQIEFLPPEQMKFIVDSTIKNRNAMIQ